MLLLSLSLLTLHQMLLLLLLLLNIAMLQLHGENRCGVVWFHS